MTTVKYSLDDFTQDMESLLKSQPGNQKREYNKRQEQNQDRVTSIPESEKFLWMENSSAVPTLKEWIVPLQDLNATL